MSENDSNGEFTGKCIRFVIDFNAVFVSADTSLGDGDIVITFLYSD
jgi:hypothetical protein|tara:strand:+ start:797 stop:934 length:138 start_codon:yes stop_codon:yes gene_type:complete